MLLRHGEFVVLTKQVTKQRLSSNPLKLVCCSAGKEVLQKNTIRERHGTCEMIWSQHSSFMTRNSSSHVITYVLDPRSVRNSQCPPLNLSIFVLFSGGCRGSTATSPRSASPWMMTSPSTDRFVSHRPRPHLQWIQRDPGPGPLPIPDKFFQPPPLILTTGAQIAFSHDKNCQVKFEVR